MNDSCKPQNQQKTMNQNQIQQKRICDYCNDATAIFFCRADSAKLCIACDREVHSSVQLFSKHTRSLLCDSCDKAPASILCETEHSVLCQNCDWESHHLSSVSAAHNRRAVEGFSGRPFASELVTVLGFEDLGLKKDLIFSEESGGGGLERSGNDGSDSGDGYLDLLFWDTPAVVSINDLIVSSSDSGLNYQALGMPPLPKNRNAACGQHKEEILVQLRELARLEPDMNDENAYTVPSNKFQAVAVGQDLQPPNMSNGWEPATVPEYEENLFPWLSDIDEATNQTYIPYTFLKSNLEETSATPDKDSVVGGCASHDNDAHEAQLSEPITPRILSLVPKVASHEVSSQQRDSALSRYKEKKRTRRYDKHVRYESRKVRAEGRTRIKGRFAKLDN